MRRIYFATEEGRCIYFATDGQDVCEIVRIQGLRPLHERADVIVIVASILICDSFLRVTVDVAMVVTS